MIETALGWLGELARTGISLFPHLRIIDARERGLRFREGHEPVELEPGRHWYWPILTDIEVHSMSRRVHDLPVQDVTLECGSPVAASASFVYRVRNVRQFGAEWDEPEDACALEVRRAVREHLQGLTRKELLEEQPADQDEALTKRARELLSRTMGVEVLSLSLTDVSLAKVFRLVGLDLGGSGE